ncbi:alanyl-tRNA editing protein [Aquibacillus kalidii]|uniref:alanyl-tRNA editing protein n=1 Tax=Aquibacillus kalidii TaxID=2762597 RepID=UPI002E2A6A92|nr:DHHA1 domain-containing protein [Aquibacillus kalidii]
MTVKLFYQDPYQQSFEAEIVEQNEDEFGYYVVLDQTAFYPTGGGQPNDLGILGDVHIVNVEEVGGQLRHYIENYLPEKDRITGEIDWNRRFDHMQQHAGQHLLSAAFEELLSYKTVSFHLGQDTCTIDLDIESLTKAEAQLIEKKVNDIILENRPIETRWVSEQELEQYQLRKKLTVKENIRLVIIPDFDYNGCGGTHPSSTGQVASLKVLDWEKQKGQVRVRFVCGNRVLQQLETKHQITIQLTQLLNAPEPKLSESVVKLNQQYLETKKKLKEANENVLSLEADSYVREMKEIDNQVIIKLLENKEMKDVQYLARQVVAKVNTSIIVLITKNENKFQIVCARGNKVEASMKTLLKNALELVNGKGGGNDSFAQGGAEATLSASDWKKLIEEVMRK